MEKARGVYAIYDRVSETLIGNIYALMVLPHPAAAVRTFQDGLKDERSAIHQHPQDYDLVRLGFLNQDNKLVPEYTVVLEGSAWLATQIPRDKPELVKEA